ncbi:MAG: EAL domain-containing protein [Pseudomonadales bacterium]
MSGLPPAVNHYLANLRVAEWPAFLLVNDEGAVIAQGGALTHYGIKPVTTDTAVTERIPVLEGVLSLQQPLVLPYIQLQPGCYADMHLFCDARGTWVVFVDTMVEGIEEQQRQQRRLSRDLMQEREQETPSMQAVLARRILSQLEIAPFEQQANGGLRLVGELPAWLQTVDNSLVEQGWCWPEQHPFLASFLHDAEGVWKQAAAHPLSSPVWIENTSNGELYLQAVAIRAGKRCLLLLQRISRVRAEHSSNTQRTNNAKLYSDKIKKRLFKEKERLQVTLHSIGDGVITTDAKGRIDFMNPIAETLTGWLLGEARRQPIERVFRVVHEDTLDPATNPVTQCLGENRVVELADHSLLISRNGDHYGVEDSAAPIRTPEGETLGAVLVFQDVTESRGLARQVEYQAHHDALTGLLNRREFERRLERALTSAQQENKQHALCFLDLDNFKIVNDTAGHMAGDALLKQIAHLLGSKLRERDSLGRLGGDEFSVLLESCPFEKAYEIAEGLVERIRSLRFTWEDQVYEVGVSVGIVPVTAEVESLAQLFTQADVACYAAKGQGRGRVVAYHADDGDSVHRHREILRAASLRNALDQDRFCLYAQRIEPLADSDNPIHYELLLRLKDESGELLLPGTFIPAAERYHLMGSIDRWVIQTALSQYEQRFGLNSRIGITINLSGNSLADEGLFDFVCEQLAASAIRPGCLCFEITETAAIRNHAHAIRLINDLRDRGCQFALDDFGSGLSSFNYLKQFPVDYLKIDGHFVKDIVSDHIDRAMVESINHVGHVIGIQTIAEYAEDQATIDILKAIGVDYAQGHAVGHPVPLADISDGVYQGELALSLKLIDVGS